MVGRRRPPCWCAAGRWIPAAPLRSVVADWRPGGLPRGQPRFRVAAVSGIKSMEFHTSKLGGDMRAGSLMRSPLAANNGFTASKASAVLASEREKSVECSPMPVSIYIAENLARRALLPTATRPVSTHLESLRRRRRRAGRMPSLFLLSVPLRRLSVDKGVDFLGRRFAIPGRIGHPRER